MDTCCSGKKNCFELPESMTFEDYVNVDSNVQTDEELTETEILEELQRGPMEEEEEEEEAEEASAIELNVCSLADAKNHLQEVCPCSESPQM